LATPKNVARIDHEKRMAAGRAAKVRQSAEAVAARIEGAQINIARQVGEGDKLFGSVTGRDIGEALSEQGISVDHRKVHLPEPIKTLGMHEVKIKLASEVQ